MGDNTRYVREEDVRLHIYIHKVGVSGKKKKGGKKKKKRRTDG